MRMDVHFVGDGTVTHHPVDDLPDLLDRDDGLVWVDIAACDDAAAQLLSDVFDVHPRALRACVERNLVPVHGPVNPAVDPDLPLRHTRAVLRRIEAGRVRPRTAFELSYAIMSGVTRHMEEFIEDLTNEVWQLEQQVTAGHLGDPEQFLEDLFRARHGLLAVRTMAVASREIYGRMTALQRFVPSDDRALVEDLVDQFSRIERLADGEKDYLQGVIEFYRARTETKMTVAAERLAVIAVVTLPITALASVYGMNVIVNDRTDFVHVAIVLAVMAAMSGLLLGWAKRHGWW